MISRTEADAFEERHFVRQLMLDLSYARVFTERVFQLRDRWIERSAGRCYTLGRATYIDMANGRANLPAAYEALTAENELLLDHFCDLYERLIEALEDALGAKVRLCSGYAVPGFHVFLGEGTRGAAVAPPHFDKQYHLLGWPNSKDKTDRISFTLPLMLPAAGSGLEYWPLLVSDIERAIRDGRRETVENFARDHPSRFLKYNVGELVVHRGLVYHRIGRCDPFDPQDTRVTLQGHGCWLRDHWLIYW